MLPLYTKNRVVGLLGGSFNPAHGGHLHITMHALGRLKCDAVWWLVSPRNPLKSSATLADYGKRLASAKALANDRRIHVSDIERKIGARYSYETIRWLKRRFRGTHFVWLIGADNLAQFHRWRKWPHLLKMLPVVVFDRAPYSHSSLRSKAAVRSRRFMLENKDISRFPPVPSLRFIHLRRDPRSSTALRKTLGGGRIFGHNGRVGP